MVSMGTYSQLKSRACTLSPGEVAGFARTFDDAAQAVWVHDLSGRCVYRNPTAGRTTPCGTEDSIHELLDHHDRSIGHIRMRAF
jgi:PAS domain-containing protein